MIPEATALALFVIPWGAFTYSLIGIHRGQARSFDRQTRLARIKHTLGKVHWPKQIAFLIGTSLVFGVVGYIFGAGVVALLG